MQLSHPLNFVLKSCPYLIIVLLFSCDNKNDDGRIDCPLAFNYWSVQSATYPTEYRPSDLFFSSNEIGYCVGKFGLIMKTVDGGDKWAILHLGNNSDAITELKLTSVFFTSDITGFVGGEQKDCCSGDEWMKGAIFLRTHDGGETWNKKYFPNIKQFYDIVFFTGNKGIGIASIEVGLDLFARKLIETNDGGETWEILDSPDLIVNSTNFLVVDSMMIVLARDIMGREILATSNVSDGNWKQEFLPDQNCNQVFFVNHSVGFITCGLLFFPETVYKTEDRGVQWRTAENSPLKVCSLVHFVTEGEGIAINAVYNLVEINGEFFNQLNSFEVFETLDFGNAWTLIKVDKSCDYTGAYYRWDNSNFCSIGEKFNRFELK